MFRDVFKLDVAQINLSIQHSGRFRREEKVLELQVVTGESNIYKDRYVT